MGSSDRVWYSALAVVLALAVVGRSQWFSERGWLYRQVSHSFSESQSFEAWLDRQTLRAEKGVRDNVAPGAKTLAHTAKGSVIASPSTHHPDYYYQWTRDAALVMSTYTRKLGLSGKPDAKTEALLDHWISLQRKIQRLSNPSSGSGHLSGLGEPKFNADATAFTGSWGRPQRDGPALRALTAIAYLRAYNASHPKLWTSTSPHGKAGWFQNLYASELPAKSPIKMDLEYVAKYWDHGGFDLWEEVSGLHFFTVMVQRKALKEGADIAARFGDFGAASWYNGKCAALSKTLDKFWDQHKTRLVATLGTSRSGLDCGILLGALHGASDGTDKYVPWSDEILLSLLDLVEDQRRRFKINAHSGIDPWLFSGVAVGRYPEDVYDGDGQSRGNPWFLCTAAVSEVLFKAAAWFGQEDRPVSMPESPRFWNALMQTETKFDWAQTAVRSNASKTLFQAGDSFLAVIRQYVDQDGSMSEQIDRDTGAQRGARDLTWSYSAFLSAVSARDIALKADIFQ